MKRVPIKIQYLNIPTPKEYLPKKKFRIVFLGFLIDSFTSIIIPIKVEELCSRCDQNFAKEKIEESVKGSNYNHITLFSKKINQNNVDI